MVWGSFKRMAFHPLILTLNCWLRCFYKYTKQELFKAKYICVNRCWRAVLSDSQWSKTRYKTWFVKRKSHERWWLDYKTLVKHSHSHSSNQSASNAYGSRRSQPLRKLRLLIWVPILTLYSINKLHITLEFGAHSFLALNLLPSGLFWETIQDWCHMWGYIRNIKDYWTQNVIDCL
jgi:hypothetical protein